VRPCAGIRSTSIARFSTSGGLRGGTQSTPSPFKAMSCVRFAGYSVRASRRHFVFVSERGTPFTAAGFARMVERAARRGLGPRTESAPAQCSATPCGYALANRGHDTQGDSGVVGASVDHIDRGSIRPLAPKPVSRISGESGPVVRVNQFRLTAWKSAGLPQAKPGHAHQILPLQ